MIVIYAPAFLAKLKKVNVRIRKSFKGRIGLFLKNPTDPILDNHPLQDEYAGYSSINITSDWRGLYNEKYTENGIIAYFSILGTHNDLYGKPKN